MRLAVTSCIRLYIILFSYYADVGLHQGKATEIHSEVQV